MDRTIYKITWMDAVSHCDWHGIEDAERLELSRTQTVGVILSYLGEKIVISAEWNWLNNFSNITVIPKGCITKISELKTGNDVTKEFDL